jgi:hypothetical protein
MSCTPLPRFAFASVDGEGRLVAWSAGWARVWGRPRSARLAGLSAADVVTPLLADPEAYRRALEAERREPTGVHATVLRHRDGRLLRRVSSPRTTAPDGGRFVRYTELEPTGQRPRRGGEGIEGALPVRAVALDEVGRATLLHRITNPLAVLAASAAHLDAELAEREGLEEARGSAADVKVAARQLRLVVNGLRRGGDGSGGPPGRGGPDGGTPDGGGSGGDAPA